MSDVSEASDRRRAHIPTGSLTTTTLRDPGCVSAIAALLGVRPRDAPFRHAGAPVPRLLLLNRTLHTEVRIDLWSALARVDVALGDCFFVFTGIDDVLLLPGVEVVFRRARPKGFLFVTTDGAVSVKA